MPGKGQTQTEETKRKISEALQKPGGEEQTTSQVARSKEAQALFDDYSKSISKTDELRAKREALKAQIKALGRKKAGKTAKSTIRKQLEAVRAEMKAEKEKRAQLRARAFQLKRIKIAKAYLDKSDVYNNRLSAMEERARQMLAKATKPESKTRMQATLTRIEQNRNRIKENVAKANDVIKSNGAIAKRESASAFNFEEHFSEQPYKPFRALTLQEKRCNFEYLNEQFNELEKNLEDELQQMTSEDIERFLQSAESKIKAGDIAAIALLGLLIRGKVKRVIDANLVAAYEAGKKTAVNEINTQAEEAGQERIDRPATPLPQTQIKNLDVNDITDSFVSEIEQTAKSNIKNALAVGAAVSAIVATTRDRMKKAAERMITNISGTLVGQYVNRGRKQVFTQNINRIARFQRSEVLDPRTCNVCISLDKLVVEASDPMAQMDIVHSHCRGVWIPIFVSEPDHPDVTGIPESIKKQFDLVDGKPTVNQFKQLKKPLK